MTTIEPARTDYAAQLAGVSSTAALWAATHLGARIVPAGTGGETGDAWRCISGRWYHDSGYELTPIREQDVPDDGVEVLDWPGKAGREAELAARMGEIAEQEYDKIAADAAAGGEAPELLAAAESLQALGLLDESLYERLTATRGEMADAAWIDEDCFRGNSDR